MKNLSPSLRTAKAAPARTSARILPIPPILLILPILPIPLIQARTSAPAAVPIYCPTRKSFRPGSLPAIDLIPEADSDGVGSVVTVSLAPECRLSALSFSYARNAETAKERLVIIDTHEWYSNQVAPLCVYETDFGGVQGLLDALEAGEFEAKLLARIHISEQETSSLGSTDEFAFSEYIVSAQEADGDVLFGRVLYAEKEGVLPEPYQTLGDGRQAVLFRPAASPSSDMSSYISRWQRIYDRFDKKYGLNALVSVD